MSCYVRVIDLDEPEEIVEVPTEDDGILLLSSLTAQFPNAVGLRYKADSGAWRGLRVEGNLIDPPDEGWGDGDYSVVNKKATKRGIADENSGPAEKLSRIAETGIADLMVGGLPFNATEDDVKRYFELNFGELDMLELKQDNEGKSRGFGFLRFKTTKATESALAGVHILYNRKFEVRYSKKSMMKQNELESIPLKLFVGRLPEGTTTTDLQEYFGTYGVLKDVYIPQPFKGFGFVQFGSPITATKVLNDTHFYKGVYLNVSTPSNKNGLSSHLVKPPRNNHTESEGNKNTGDISFLQNIAKMATQMVNSGGLNNWMQNGSGFSGNQGSLDYDQVHKKKDKFDRNWKRPQTNTYN